MDIAVAETSEILPGQMKKVLVGNKEILLANVGGQYFAINNRCTHQGGDLSSGKLEGNVVTCPRHGSKFDVTTGKLISGPKILFLKIKINDEIALATRVEGNKILIKE
ncbi:MAG: non-heme iron oxygenase ferredoxin subunit [Candidatus Methanomethylicus sp.]|nr:non-heme iron oxygenase ferredoxin subunit [Candidatus Methanomethylicus sp.]